MPAGDGYLGESDEPHAVLSRISNAKNELYDPKDYLLLAMIPTRRGPQGFIPGYQEQLAASHALISMICSWRLSVFFKTTPQSGVLSRSMAVLAGR